MKILFLILVSALSLSAYDASNVTSDKCSRELKRLTYEVCFSDEFKSPLYSKYNAIVEQVLITKERYTNFSSDKELPELLRVNDKDYYKAPYDKGHLFPMFMADWSETSAREANLFTNIVPQNSYLNRQGAWRKAERLSYDILKKNNFIVEVSGVYFNVEDEIDIVIGNNVYVPDKVFKAIIVPSIKKYIVFIYDNRAVPHSLWYSPISPKDLEEMTGVRLNIPEDYIQFTKEELE